MSATAFKAYLIYECDFVETAMLIFGHMLVKAPALAERRWLAGVLQALAVDQSNRSDSPCFLKSGGGVCGDRWQG
ncbi:MAG: hypothetical protein WB760_15300 [Xanthobacteraceae bacterium]